MCLFLRQQHGLLLIALQVLIVHQRPLCIQSLTPKLLTRKRPHTQLRWVGTSGNRFEPTDQRRCDDLWKVIVHEKRKASEIRLSPTNQAHLYEETTGKKRTREQLVFLRVRGKYMEDH